MSHPLRRGVGALCALALLLGILPAGVTTARAASSGLTKQSGHLESAYIEWPSVPGATRYEVWVKKATESDETYTQLDDELIRKYPDHWRADALGLAAGEYVLKVAPYKDETALPSLVSDTLTVLAHDRGGYAFSGGNVPGAYSADGTLKPNAQVVYVTNETKSTVKLGSYTGLQSIVSNVGKIGKPVDIRILGHITGLSNNLLSVSTQNANLTIEGVGNDATAYGWGVQLANCSHVELRNLAIMMVASTERDGATLESANYTWVHNCEFFYNQPDPSEDDKQKGDGSLDTKKSQYVTHSYNHFWDSGKCSLQGSNTSDTSDYITYHHNWYDHSDSRHPRVRVAHVHVYNNYYDHNDEYGVGAVYHATVFAQNNYFDDCSYPMLIAQQGSDPGYFTGNSGTGESGGMLKACGNTVVGGAYVPYSETNQTEFDAYEVDDPATKVPSDVTSKSADWPYDNFDTANVTDDNIENYIAKKNYKLDAAADVPEIVTTYAGRVEGGDFTFDMDTLTKGKEPDAGLQAAIDSYACALLSVGGADPDPVSDSGYTLDGDALTLTEAVPAGQRVWAACWDAQDRFLGVKALTTGTAVQLDPRWSRAKLLRLTEDALIPQRPVTELQK